MFKTILAQVRGDETDSAVLASAARVARLSDAHLDLLHVRIDPVEFVAAVASADVGGAMLASDWIDRLERDAEALSQKARKAIETFTASERVPLTASPTGQAGLSASYLVETGREAERIVSYAQTADLVVLGRGNGAALGARAILEAALFGSGRPILVPGKRALPPTPSTIAIAWKPTREAARAVASAMPLIVKASRVVVVMVTEDDESETASAQRLAIAIGRQGPSTKVAVGRSAAKEAPDTVLALAAEGGADLLVTGGYGHSRLREMVFGGFTERVLGEIDLPLLMAH